MLYAGIGSRDTPDNIQEIMIELAKSLANKGYILRSGGAKGADRAFEVGAGSAKEIFRPKQATAKAIELASQFHPAWHNCNKYVRSLHGRNAQIILGKELVTPVEFVLCWTKNGKDIGGTGLGIRLAIGHNIPVKNLYDINILEEVTAAYL